MFKLILMSFLVVSCGQDDSGSSSSQSVSETTEVKATLVADLSKVECTEDNQGALVYLKDVGFYFCDLELWVPIEIKGKDGKDGRDGLDGQSGKDGSDGSNGRDGVNGVAGKNGIDDIDSDAFWINPITEARYILVTGSNGSFAANYDGSCPLGSKKPDSADEVKAAYWHFKQKFVYNAEVTQVGNGYARYVMDATGSVLFGAYDATTSFPFICKIVE